MGSTFRYIKDSALKAEDSSYYNECHACARKDAPVYKASGFIIKNDGTFDDEDPDSGIYVACEACIKSGKLARFGEWEMTPFLKSMYENWEELRQKLRATPQIPLFLQRDDWVVCCNDICEFTGVPENYEDIVYFTSKANYWARGQNKFSRNFKEDGPPESILEISKFECIHCRKTYWIDQFT